LCKAAVEENEFSRLISRLSIPTSESNEIVATCVRERRAFVVHEARHSPNVSRSFADTIRVDEFACAPLIARGEVFGVLIVDNLFTRRPILEADSQVLSTFANQAALALATVRGYQRLQTQVVQVQRMQERLVEAERMAAVGNVAAQVAHEIRNPLFVIGGYARRLAGLSDIPHEAAECAHVIIDEAGRLGNILARVLDYLQESQGTLERADLNAVAEAAIDSVRETIDATRWFFAPTSTICPRSKSTPA
jgi:signal transduction histidine kinase